jgi:hypothetical protein
MNRWMTSRIVTLCLRHTFALYSGGRDKAVHEWRSAAWHAGAGEGLVFAGNALPPSCGDVVLSLAAHGDSGTVVAGAKNGCVQTWRGGKADGSSSIGHGHINAVQVRQPAAAHACDAAHALQLLGCNHVLVGCADGCVVKVTCVTCDL